MLRSRLTLVVALGVTGCGPPYSYQLVNSPHVTMTAGEIIYKNGKKYKDLRDAVADNPRALEEARRAQSMAVTGNWLAVGSVAVGVAGAVTLITNESATNENKTTKVAAQSMLAGAIVVGIVALVVGTNGTSHELNAIKIYNDDVDAKMRLEHPATPAAPR